jgi:hypothetical protein
MPQPGWDPGFSIHGTSFLPPTHWQKVAKSGSAPRWVMISALWLSSAASSRDLMETFGFGVGAGVGSHLVVGSLEIFDAECIDSHH